MNTIKQVGDTLNMKFIKYECTDYNKFYLGQTKKKKISYSQHLNAFIKPIYMTASNTRNSNNSSSNT